jgi:hypothetical protein
MKLWILLLLVFTIILENVAAEELHRSLRRNEKSEQETILAEQLNSMLVLSAEEKKTMDSEVFDRFLASDGSFMPTPTIIRPRQPVSVRPPVPAPLPIRPSRPSPTRPRPTRPNAPTRPRPTRPNSPTRPRPTASIILPPVPKFISSQNKKMTDERTPSAVAKDATTDTLSMTNLQKEGEKTSSPSTAPAPIIL